ncbi:hypothetical protein C8Q77DRAFT_649244 [Trametes polyzona]|nr:hypothetical protein C8Q77DRAFT_649244 [Trametes polyzona]
MPAPTFPPAARLLAEAAETLSFSRRTDLGASATSLTQDLSLFISSTSSDPPLSLSLFAYDVAASSQSYEWHPVNVTPGVYEITAVGESISSISQSLVVSRGTSASCLNPPLWLPSASSPDPSPGASRGSNSHVHASRAGAIVGGVIGGLVLLMALAGMYIYVRLRRRAVPRFRWRDFTHFGPRGPRRTWSGLSSHVNINVPEPLYSMQERPAAPLQTNILPLRSADHLPRLEPNRRKPSVTLDALPVSVSPKPSEPTPTIPPPAHILQVDKELPPPPSSEVSPTDPLRRSPTVDSTDAASVIWLRRRSSAVLPMRRPSSASAVPSSATSQMYRIRDSMWMASPDTPEPPERVVSEVWSACRGPRPLVRTHTQRMRSEAAPAVPPLPDRSSSY